MMSKFSDLDQSRNAICHCSINVQMHSTILCSSLQIIEFENENHNRVCNEFENQNLENWSKNSIWELIRMHWWFKKPYQHNKSTAVPLYLSLVTSLILYILHSIQTYTTYLNRSKKALRLRTYKEDPGTGPNALWVWEDQQVYLHLYGMSEGQVMQKQKTQIMCLQYEYSIKQDYLLCNTTQ